ncbi:hypothetical protein [Bradyrhizobium sp.]|uniref:hypothetical protein n=1 Tax=Bradyrhizobium sp. TaxID=376 RepID=UPI001DB19175|nr:hypothetical protein [Bradyrhizobium sp.]MBI5321638.1 hypothetical protein [Bradyrhizobium sp.]
MFAGKPRIGPIWIAWGGESENLAAARQRLAIVLPACFVMILLLLLSAMGSARDALLVFSVCIPFATLRTR